ncbi:hypothetical protein MLD38_006664 [Melastoma candidum]|uniref:Uncharacterized protein n=1 Tax=Melastoma candidum TaxID=119954 RepID=A0ACB9RST6_9MYRT|nr:hypothetical protein MLD38_006664 [Melastoma candidum]
MIREGTDPGTWRCPRLRDARQVGAAKEALMRGLRCGVSEDLSAERSFCRIFVGGNQKAGCCCVLGLLEEVDEEKEGRNDIYYKTGESKAAGNFLFPKKLKKEGLRVGVINLEDEYVKQPLGNEVQPIILNSNRFYPYFKDCLGAIDGTHVRVKDQTFTAAAYRNVVTNFNMIHGTNIQKKHIFSRMKTMKQHFVLFHNAFHSLSGFAWNHESQKFEAEDHVWDERIKANPKLAQLRDKSIQNWDKLYELWGNNRATGEHACGLKEKAKQLKRRLPMSADGLSDGKMDSNDCVGNQESSNEDHYTSQYGSEPITLDNQVDQVK